MTTKHSDQRPCSQCPLVRNTINGHYCTRLRIITEHMQKAPCKL